MLSPRGAMPALIVLVGSRQLALSDDSPCPVPRAARLDDCAADVPIRTMTLVHRIQFHVKPQALQLLVMERP